MKIKPAVLRKERIETIKKAAAKRLDERWVQLAQKTRKGL